SGGEGGKSSSTTFPDKETPRMSENSKGGSSRREFLATAAAATAAVSAGLSWVPNVHAAGDDVIKVGLVGCGGRGTRAAENGLHPPPKVERVALGYGFQDRLAGCRNRLREVANDAKVKEMGNKFSVKDENCFVGLDAYEKVIGSNANYIILATPPGFRPIHLQ